MSTQRWKAFGVERIGGRPVVTLQDRSCGVSHRARVHYKLGRWRYRANDKPVADRAAVATARRAIKAADVGSVEPTEQETIMAATATKSKKRTPAKKASSKAPRKKATPTGKATSTTGGLSARDAAIEVLGKADEPMTAAEILAEIRKRKLAPGLKGKTPQATIAAQLYVSIKRREGVVRKAGRGKFQAA